MQYPYAWKCNSMQMKHFEKTIHGFFKCYILPAYSIPSLNHMKTVQRLLNQEMQYW